MCVNVNIPTTRTLDWKKFNPTKERLAVRLQGGTIHYIAFDADGKMWIDNNFRHLQPLAFAGLPSELSVSLLSVGRPLVCRNTHGVVQLDPHPIETITSVRVSDLMERCAPRS